MSVVLLIGVGALLYAYMKKEHPNVLNNLTVQGHELNQPEYLNRNKVVAFGLEKTDDDGLHESSNQNVVNPTNKVIVDHEPPKIEDKGEKQEVYEHPTNLRLHFMAVPVIALTDRHPNKNLDNAGLDVTYIPHKTGIAKLFEDLKYTVPLKQDIDMTESYAPPIHPQKIS